MGLVTTRVSSLLLAAVLTSSFAAEPSRTADNRWSKRISDRRVSDVGGDWVPLNAPCPSCQPNDRISSISASDQVASLLTPPLPDYQQPPSFLPLKQFREQPRPIAQQLVHQPNGHQQFIQPIPQEFPPKFQHLPELPPNNAPKPEVQKPFVSAPTSQFFPPSNVGVQLLQTNSHLATDGQHQFIKPPVQQEFTLQQPNFPQLVAQDSHIQFNTDPNQMRNSHYQQFIGQFLQSQQPPLNLGPQSTNESEASSNEEKPEIQLVYVPVEALNQRGRFNIPRKPASHKLTELKGDLQLQHEPSALAAEESRQQRQNFQQYFEQQLPSAQSQTQTQRPHPPRIPQQAVSTAQPQHEENQAIEQNQQPTHQILQGQRPQPTGIPQQVQVPAQQEQPSLGQQLIHSLRTHPTGVPQQLHKQQQEQQLAVPIQGPHSTRVPQLHMQHHQILQEPLINQEHFLQYLRPLPTIAAELQQQQQQQQLQQHQQHILEQQLSPTLRPHSTQIPQLQLQQSIHEGQFLQTQEPHNARVPAQAQQEATEEPSDPQIFQTQRPTPTRAPQSHRPAATQPSTQQPPLETQRPLHSTRAPQLQELEQRFPQQSTTIKPAKPVPHQPPLSVYMGKEGHDIKIADVIKVLKHAKTIAVLDSVGPESPQVFVGPSNLKPPLSYAKFELPYLSSIESNRVERKVDKLPFFVAPLNFNPPAGYSKIPFPAPHIGSVVVSNVTERDPLYGKDDVNVPVIKPTRGRFSSQYSLPADLPAINPQLPTLVNSLQDSRQQGNVFLTPTQAQGNVQQAPTRRPHQQPSAQHLNQVPHEQQIQQFQEIRQVSEAPGTSRFQQTHRPPQFNQFSDFQHVTTTPQTHHFSVGAQHAQREQFPEVNQVSSTPQFTQTIPTEQAPHPSQFPQTHHVLGAQEIPQFGQYPSRTHLVSPNPSQNPQPQQTHHVTQASEIPQFQQFSDFNQVQQAPKSQQFHESSQVSESPEIQQYQAEQEASKEQIPAQQVETEVQLQDLPTTPNPRIPKRRPTYRARQRTTEASTTEDSSTTTRRPYTRGRRPYTGRSRLQQQDIESQQDKPSTTPPQNQFQVEVEPVSTTEYFSGFKYSTRAPIRTQTDNRFQNTRTSAQEDTPKRNNVPRTRTRTRERNSQRVTGQNILSYQTQNIEGKRQNLNLQDEQDAVVPPHESRRQQAVFNQHYNTERSGFEEPTTENNRFEQINSNSPHQIAQNEDISYQQQGLQFQNALPVSPTIQPFSEYQTSENYFPVSTTSQPDVIPFQEISHPVSSTTAHPELNSFLPNQPPQSADFHRTRGHPQLVNEQPVRLPHFTLPVQVSVSGQTEKPDVEDTPRPVYVRIRGHTRGRRPQAQGPAGAQRAVPQYQQQQETSESLQKTVPQNQDLAYQHQSRRPVHDIIQHQQPLQLTRQRVPQVSSEIVQDDFKVVSPKPEESEEEYGFIRPVSFPPSTVNHEATTFHAHQHNSFEESQSQESQESQEDLSQKIPVNRVRQNFLGRPNRRPVPATEDYTTTTPSTTVFTVRPSRRQQPVKQQVRLTSIRGRMRRPTTSTTEQSEAINTERQQTSTESQFIRRRPVNRFTPSVAFNEVSGESHDAFATPRNSLQRYESPSRSAGVLRRPAVTNEEEVIAEAPSTPSSFQITLLDDPTNFQSYNEQPRVQEQYNFQHGRPEDSAHLNSEHLARFLNEDPEGGAESQWATKRLPYIFSGHDASTIALISFTTELPSVEQTVTDIPVVATKENVTIDGSNLSTVESSGETIPVNQEEVEQPTTEDPTDLSPKTLDAEENLSKDGKEESSQQKKASDHNLEKKTSSGRRGTWVRVRKVQRPQDFLETAESQNIGALSKNQLQVMASKGSLITSWPLPSPTVVLDKTVFDVPKISSGESYVTVDESAGDVFVPSRIVKGENFNGEQTFENQDKSEVVSLTTTTERSGFTELNINDELTTLYVTPSPEDTSTSNRVLKEIISITTDRPSIETTTPQYVTDRKPAEANPTTSNHTSDETIEFNDQIKKGVESLSDEIKDKEIEEIPEVKGDNTETVEGSTDEAKTYGDDKPTEATNIPKDNENEKVVETTTEAEVKHQTHEDTTESSHVRVKDEDNEETVERTSYNSKDLAHKEHLLIQSSVRDAIQQNTPTEGTTDKPGILHAIGDTFNESATTTEVNSADIDSPDEIIRTSMRTEVSHETEICFRGRCVKTKSTDNDHLAE